MQPVPKHLGVFHTFGSPGDMAQQGQGPAAQLENTAVQTGAQFRGSAFDQHTSLADESHPPAASRFVHVGSANQDGHALRRLSGAPFWGQIWKRPPGG